jgi:hypothetical protein
MFEVVFHVNHLSEAESSGLGPLFQAQSTPGNSCIFAQVLDLALNDLSACLPKSGCLANSRELFASFFFALTWKLYRLSSKKFAMQ